MRIKAGTCFAEENQPADEVFFLLSGCVKREASEETKRGIDPNYLVEGVIFGEGDVIQKVPRRESFTAVSDCYTLKLSRFDFQDILGEFEDFRSEVLDIARERERLRTIKINKARAKEQIDEFVFVPPEELDKIRETLGDWS